MIDLFLDCCEQRHDRLSFCLKIINNSGQRLLLPFPEITDLVFLESATNQQSEWFTHLLVSSAWRGMILEPEQEREVPLIVRPRAVKLTKTGHFAEEGDYARYCVELHPGNYSVSYSLTVDRDYFDGDSHWRFSHLEREASVEGAIPWTGRAQSNDIALVIP